MEYRVTLYLMILLDMVHKSSNHIPIYVPNFPRHRAELADNGKAASHPYALITEQYHVILLVCSLRIIHICYFKENLVYTKPQTGLEGEWGCGCKISNLITFSLERQKIPFQLNKFLFKNVQKI